MSVESDALKKGIRHWPLYHKIGTGLGVVGLGVGAANLVDSRRHAEAEQHRIAVEQKSLAALQKIHKALTIKPVGE